MFGTQKDRDGDNSEKMKEYVPNDLTDGFCGFAKQGQVFEMSPTADYIQEEAEAAT